MDPTLPPARTRQLIVEVIGDETLVYDLERHRAHSLNHAASTLWSACDGRTTVPEAAALLSRELGIPEDAEIVELGLRELARAQLLTAPAAAERALVSRRRVVGRLALRGAVGALLPAVMTIVAPTPAEAATFITTNQCVNPANWGKCCKVTPSVRRKCVGGMCNGTLC